MTNGHIELSNWLLAHLAPLRRGEAVRLVAETQTQHGKTARLSQKGLLIAPGRVYGLSDQAVVMSLLGSGSCVVFPAAQNSRGELVKMGLTGTLATALIEVLNQLYGESQHGTTTSKNPRTRRSRPQRTSPR